MKISEALLPEFDQESAMTRSVLERCPEAKFHFKPHAKSWELIQLASHLANLPYWLTITLKQDAFDMTPPGGERYKEVPLMSAKELLAKFDKNTAEARAAISGTEDAEFGKPWSLMNAGATLFTMPKGVCVRTFCLNHAVFHRGQLTVYLRLIDVPVPAIYGPSADETS